MLTSNYMIINRKARPFATMRVAGKTAIFLDAAGKVLDFGVMSLGDTVYAALYCDEVRNITFVTDVRGVHDVTTLLWCSEEGYEKDGAALRKASGARFSEQNTRINRYAEAIAEKLDNGVELRVTDAVNEDDMVECPECGMLNPAGSKYCLDCGAEIGL